MSTARSESRMGGLWMLKAFSGIFLVVLFLIHLLVNHLVGSANGLLTYEEVAKYYDSWYIPAMEIIFLILVVTHSLLGMRSIFLDFNPSINALKAVNWLFIIIGCAFIIYGAWLVVQIAQINV